MQNPKAKRGYTLVSEKSYQSPLMRGKDMMKVGIDTMIKILWLGSVKALQTVVLTFIGIHAKVFKKTLKPPKSDCGGLLFL